MAKSSFVFVPLSTQTPLLLTSSCITKSKLAVPHSFSSLPRCTITTISPKQTCPKSDRMFVTELKHSQPQQEWKITFSQRPSSCSTDFQKRNLSILSPSTVRSLGFLCILLIFCTGILFFKSYFFSPSITLKVFI